ncbi:NAD(P)/FAD-dependent oxidoreductase [Nocardia farcinica]|uniref:flavin-containing monooxygenase n=1 Tax=Nocardia farcinica TaxID=37329 RepID=UPI0018952327|nr:NAD(P)/FAD-dependent oxidoreductase [Nocardia farcinica]MBF6445982.1 NAD(P)/FAD-dependent oxidoreductase [Nocardia farcinica]
MTVAVVGAGFGGIGMGIALRRDGIADFLILESADAVGGVWRDNTYPGCSCDVPAHLYSLSAAPYRDPAIRYPRQADTLAYLERVVDTFALRPHLRLGTTVIDATYDEHHGHWILTTTAGPPVTADIVIFSVGMLHRPRYPNIPGLGDFSGPVMHSARWDHGIDLCGRRVAVIGTGASAIQIIPAIAGRAERVTVYQRTPTWVLPKPGHEFGPATKALLAHLPGGHRLYRSLTAAAADALLAPIMTRGWTAPLAESIARTHLRRQIRDPRLRAALTPAHPVGAKRILLSNDYYPALTRDDVELVTTGIHSVTDNGVRTVDGTIRDTDIIVCATGFRASEFLAHVCIRGRGGRLLADRWADGAEAYLGTALPGFPNLFLIAGPSTFNPAGSNITIKESQIALILAALRWRERIGAAAIEPSTAAMNRYRRWLIHAWAHTVWPGGGPSWYKTPHGQLVTPWPSTARAFDRAARRHPATVFRPAPTALDAPSGTRAPTTPNVRAPAHRRGSTGPYPVPPVPGASIPRRSPHQPSSARSENHHDQTSRHNQHRRGDPD